MKILYILGSARCGSTILANALGEVPSVFSAGEIRFLWERAEQGRMCGCGEPVSRCPIWSAALSAVPEGWPLPPLPADVVGWQRQATPLARTWHLLRTQRPSAGDPLDSYVRTMRAVLSTLVERTGTELIVDSSKRPSNGAALRLVPDVEPFFLHLIRDPRAVAYSRAKAKANPDRADAGVLGQRSVLDSVEHWGATNVACDAVRRRMGSRAILVRYEDFVARPHEAIDEILRLVGVRTTNPISSDGSVTLGTNHTVSGNPDRFTTGEVRLSLDERWVAGMRDADRRFVTVATAPLLLRYGYPLRHRGGDGA